ncbi:MAG: ABC transporter permease [Candidatus Nanohaloarchaea archaeon]
MLDSFRLVIRNLRYRKKRSWLTIIGTFVGILAIVALISIGQGLESSVRSEFKELGGDKVFISPGGSSLSSRFTASNSKLRSDDLRTVRNTRGVSEATGIISSSKQISYSGETEFLTVLGLPTGPGAELVRETQGVEILRGRYIRRTDSYNVLVTSQAARNAFSEEIYLRSKIEINGSEFRVVGIVEQTGTGGADIYMEMEKARKITGKENVYDQIIARTAEGFPPSEVQQNVRESLRQARNLERNEEDFTTRTAADIIDSFQSQLSLIRGFLVGLGTISLLVGGVGIMNTMYTSVAERTREIGVMKAVGATNWQILRIFLIESGIIGLTGGLLGVIGGLGVSYVASEIISSRIGIQMTPGTSPELILGSLAFAFLVGTISGFLPARKAAKLEPVEALRYEK